MGLSYFRSYSANPRHFLNQYRADATNLRRAVAAVSRLLAENKVAGKGDSLTSVGEDLISIVLRVGGQGSWGLLSVTQEICQPEAGRVRAAWEFLNTQFAPGTKSVALADALLPLLNAPFGYDYNRLCLLFCAWYGYHAHELQLTSAARPASLLDSMSSLDQPRNFINRLAFIEQIRVTRVDRAKIDDEVRMLIDRVRNENLSRDQARDVSTRLRDYLQSERNNPAIQTAAANAVESLQRDLERADEFLKELGAIESAISGTASFDKLLPLYDRISGLPQVGRVKEAGWSSAADLNARLTAAVKVALDPECKRCETLTRLIDYSQNQTRLTNLRTRLQRLSAGGLTPRVDQALATLDTRRQELEAQQQDQGILAELRGMNGDRGLRELRENLKRLAEAKPHSQAACDAVQKKRAELEASVQRLETQLVQVGTRIETVTKVADAQHVHRDLLRVSARYAGTPEQADLDQLIQRAAALETFLHALNSMADRPLAAPAAVTEFTAALTQLGAEHAAYLGEAQQSLLRQMMADVERRADGKRREAVAWLERLEQDAQNPGNAADLLRRSELVHPFIADAERPRLQAIQARLSSAVEADRLEQEARRQDTELRARLQALHEKGPLRDLRVSLDVLGTLEPRAAATRALMEQKEAALKDAIQKACDRVTAFEERLQSLATRADAQQLQNEMLRASNSYQDTPEMERLNTTLEHCGNLLRYLEAIDQLRGANPRSPGEAADLQVQLAELRSASRAYATPAQQALVDAAQEALNAKTAQRTEAATTWLTEQERLFERRANVPQLQQALANPPHFLPADQHHRLDALRAAIEAHHEQQRQARQEEALRKSIAALPVDSPLARIRADMEYLAGLTPSAPETVEVVRSKSEALCQAETDAVRQVWAFEERLAGIDSAEAARKLEAQVQRVYDRYRETEELARLQAVLDRCREAEGALREVQQLGHTEIQDPQNAAALRQKIVGVSTRLNGAGSPALTGAFQAALTSVEERVLLKQQEALSWLARCEHDLEQQAPPDGIVAKLSRPPAFLPASEHPRLDRALKLGQQRIDSDVVLAITSQFRQIRDPHKRQECLTALQKLVQELGSA